jgi:hypothetical protein
MLNQPLRAVLDHMLHEILMPEAATNWPIPF